MTHTRCIDIRALIIFCVSIVLLIDYYRDDMTIMILIVTNT